MELIRKSFTHPLSKQVMRFGIIGGSAAAVNFLVVLLMVELFSLPPLIANIFAFLTAFQISFFGHKTWTFRETKPGHLSAMSKFFIVAAISFVLNEGLFALFLTEAKLYYPVALLLTLIIVPPITFISSKLWAFKA